MHRNLARCLRDNSSFFRASSSAVHDSAQIVAAVPLRALVSHLTQLCGSDIDESCRIAENLVMSNLKGHDSHGVGYLPRYIRTALKSNLVPNQSVKIIGESDTMISLDGGRGYGQSVGKEAMKLGIQKAREHKMCIVSLRNSHHLARIGAWAEMCTAAGFMSLHFVNVAGHEPLVAPHNGGEAKLGTNPICIGFPDLTDKADNVKRCDIILDYATSQVALGKVREAYGRGELMPQGCLLDHSGRETKDPSVKFCEKKGSLLPFGDHKGYALALMCELIGAVATGGQTIAPEWERDDTIINSMFTVIIDPSRTSTSEAPQLASETEQLMSYVTAAERRPGSSDDVMIPGEPERNMYEKRIMDGIPISEGTWSEILHAASSLGVSEDDVHSILKQN